MTVRHYRRRPPEVDAIRFDGFNGAEVAQWCGGRVVMGDDQPHAVLVAVGQSRISAWVGDYVVREVGPDGGTRFWPMKGTVFEWAYELVR